MSTVTAAALKLEQSYYELLDAKHKLQEDDDTSPVIARLDGVLSQMSATMRLLRESNQ